MKLNVQSAKPGLVRLASEGDITLVGFDGAATALEAILPLEAFQGIALLSLQDSLYIDSSAVGWLIQCHFRFQNAGGKLILHSVPPMVDHAFRVLGMYGVLHIVRDEAAAERLALEPRTPPATGEATCPSPN